MSEVSLRIMTYNTHHSAGIDECVRPITNSDKISGPDSSLDLPRVAEVINAENPDIVALQEVDRFWARSGGVDQPEEFSKLLSMEARFGANLIHEPDDHADAPHEFGVATLSRHPIVRYENQFLPTTIGWEQRGVLDTRILVPGIGEIAVLNTHLQSNANGEQVEAASQRGAQARAIADLVARLDIPVIVLGDFNAESESGEIDSLIGPDSMLSDVWTIAGVGSGETIFNGAHGESIARIDYILVSPQFHVVSAEVIDDDRSRMASDHFPLVAELVFIGTDCTS